MPKLTPEGEKMVDSLATRYSLGADAVKNMLDAVAKGGGTMAQFNLPELGGNGKWMLGGVTMIGDMFNNTLKAMVDSLCTELSNLVVNQAAFFVPALQSQSQSQGAGKAIGEEGASPYVPQSAASFVWWPEELGHPSSTGTQNSIRYAYFPERRRLAIDHGGGRICVYDTTGHNIQGFSQQQGGSTSFTFTSQLGTVRLESLPRDYGSTASARRTAEPPPSRRTSEPSAAPKTSGGGDAGPVLALIEQLAGLKEKGVLTEEEFAAKKAELLKRL